MKLLAPLLILLLAQPVLSQDAKKAKTEEKAKAEEKKAEAAKKAAEEKEKKAEEVVRQRVIADRQAKMMAMQNGGATPQPAAAPSLSDEQILRNVHLEVTGAALTDLFRQRVTPSVDAKRLDTLTEQLSYKAAGVHTKAAAELVGLGPIALPALRRAINHADNEETISRARKCLEAIEGRSGATLMQSAVRLLAQRNPQGAVEALMDYLPFADDDVVVQEIETALEKVGSRDGKVESALTRALSDSVPVRRRVAARVLCQIGGASGRDRVRPLLKDAKPSVRMQAALSLVDVNDAQAMPVLIDLVAELPPDARKQVESYLHELAGEWSVRSPQGSDVLSGKLRRELWSAWWRTLDGKQLLEEFRNRTLSNLELARAQECIRKLEDTSVEVRAKASDDLVRIGPRVASLLRMTINQGNPRLAEPARQCLEALERDEAKPLPEAAPRLLALRHPPGALEALLAYVPFAETETVSQQLTDLLTSLGCNEGKADPVLVRALEDKISVRRAAAAMALCKGKADTELPAIRKLYNDPDTTVRLRAALALAQRGDRSSIPVLIALLGDLPLDSVWEAEDVLLRLAGDNAPNERVGTDKASRTASVNAWKTWWTKEGKSTDLAQLNDPTRDSGLLLAIENQTGRIVEMTRRGQIRWKMEGLQWPLDALVCPNGNVFVIHQSGNWLSMRDRHGKELWQKNVNQGFICQRLRNGNIFVACHQSLHEFDANGKEVSSHMPNVGWIVGAAKFPNGHMAYLTQQGQYTRVDAAGKQVKNYQAALNGCVAMSAEVLAGDHVVTTTNTNHLVEFGDTGKSLWEANVINPGFPHRMLNGHTLVVQNGTTHLYEFDRKGKVVSEKKDLECMPWRIRQR